ncbi:hypothetical protein AAHA92_12391 [Salvia divinorum]|uniref:Uncharacterized protein n=1 Tax=Salvia divinorum TaxID=28513 RepID=A0ABD1HK30_SALDI
MLLKGDVPNGVRACYLSGRRTAAVATDSPFQRCSTKAHATAKHPKGARQKTVEEQTKIRKEKAKATYCLVEVQDEEDGDKRMSRKGLMAEYTCRLCGQKRTQHVDGIQLGKPKGPTIRKKRNRDEEQPNCMLCHQLGHNRTGCSSVVADMYSDVATSEVVASSSVPLKKKT